MEKKIEYKFTNGQLEPKNGKRWLEMVGLHKSIPVGSLTVPAEMWYYFYVMGIEIGRIEAKKDLKEHLTYLESEHLIGSDTVDRILNWEDYEN